MLLEKDLANPQSKYTHHQLNRKEMLSYGAGFFGLILVWTLVGTFLTFYYTDIAGISAGVVGTLMLVGRLFDGVTDIGMGTVVDRTTSKHGKARPWILWMGIPLAISTVLLFSVPEWSSNGKIAYAYITYILMILFYTAMSIPYKTLLGLMTQEPKERSILNIYTGVFTMLSTLAITVLAQPAADAIGGKLGWTVVAGASALIIVFLSLIAFRSTQERVTSAVQRTEHVPLTIGLTSLIKNKYWLIITLYCIIAYTLNALLSGAGLYYSTYMLGNTSYFSIIGLVLFLPTMIGFFIIPKLVVRYGKRNLALAVSGIGIFGSFVKMIDPNHLGTFVAGTIVQGFGLIPIIVFLYAMINDTAEYGEWKFGVRTEGLVNSAASFGMKVGAGLGGGLIGWMLMFGGYVGGQEQQSESAMAMILALGVYLPLALSVIQTILLWMYKLDHHYPAILADLHERRNNAKHK